MSRLFSNDADHEPRADFGAEALYIRGENFRNSAAKFWSSLADEITTDYPACSSIEISALTGAPISRQALFPGAAIGIEDSLAAEGLSPAEALRNAMSELELFGLPSAVHARLFSREREILSLDLPGDCVDADILPYLLAWLLEWSGAHEATWGGERTAGAFIARDRKRRIRYRFDFTITSTHVSEGLYERSANIRLNVERGDRSVGKQSGYEVNA